MPQHTNRMRRARRPRVLAVDSDEATRTSIIACVQLAACEADGVDEGAAAAKLAAEDYELVIWGLSAPAARLPEALTVIGRRRSPPLILLGEDGSELEQAGLQLAAAQTLPTPFMPSLLVGAIKAALHRVPTSLMELADLVQLNGDLTFDARARRLQRDGQMVDFTRQEWQLLGILASRPGSFLEAQEIVALGWQAGDHQTDQLRTYVARLRSKLAPLGSLQLISQPGRGYCLVIK